MRVEIAKYAGFCYGVTRAVQGIEALLDAGKSITTLGPVIHNEHVVQGLQRRGAGYANEVAGIQTPVAVIASHGAGPAIYAQMRDKGLEIVDLTCMDVQKIHQRIAGCNMPVVIVGKPGHTEVMASKAYAPKEVFIISTKNEVSFLPRLERALVVAQTTLVRQEFNDIVDALKERIAEITVMDSICKATELRQREALALAKRVDAVVVVGGKHSSNTTELFETCRSVCKRTYFIESANELRGIRFDKRDYIGITAGASTPDEIIKEVVTIMSELDKTLNQTDETTMGETVENTAASIEEVVAANEEVQEDMNAEPEFASAFEETMVSIRPGLTVVGTVVQVTSDEVCVNIGYKSDGIVPRNQLTNQDMDSYKIGDEIEVEVVKVNDGEGNVLLSQRNIVNRKVFDELVAKVENGEYLEGVGKNVVKGGLIVDVQGIRTFVPASQLSERYVEKIDQFVGKEMQIKIIEVDKQKRRLVGSRKAFIQEEGAAKKAAAWEKLEVGKLVHGVVRRLTDFGAFVDLGGVDGLIHITDLSWGRVKHPSVVVKPGTEVDVLVLALDHERERISLGLKQTKPKPWETATVNYPAGSIVEGTVVRIVTFGAFVELEPGLDGLVHISQVASERIEKVEDRLNVGDVVRVLVLDVNPDTRRISLSIRQAADYGDETDLPDDGDLSFDDLPLDDDTEAVVTDMETAEAADAAVAEVAEEAAQEEQSDAE